MLYPLKFRPVYKTTIWGGRKLQTVLNKDIPAGTIGESWEISSVPGSLSVVANGIYAENTIEEMIEIFMGELVGDAVYNRFGLEFPLLLKFIDAAADLSVQVHPDDKTARERHEAYGKTEMWYVLQADENATLISGFNQDLTRELYLKSIENKRIAEVLNAVPVAEGDVFYIPPGRVHTIGKSILLAEIQQSSDITYRIYDWDRTDAEGKSRQLHTDEALDVLDFRQTKEAKTAYVFDGDSAFLKKTDYFTVNRLNISGEKVKNYVKLDSFVVYMCLSGKLQIQYPNGSIDLQKGETILIPAEFDEVQLKAEQAADLLEIYIEP